ncbi:MAG: cupredoxin domain-containing protein [Thermomicrobiales bacterium]
MFMVSRFGSFLAIASLSLVLLAACGSSSDSKKEATVTQVGISYIPGTPAPGGSAAAATVPSGVGGGASASVTEIDMDDIKFDQTEVTTPAGKDVAVTLANKGAGPHNFNIDALNIHSGDYEPGKKGTVTVNAPAGTYEYYCNIPGHKEAGMVGKLIVTADSAGGAPSTAATPGSPAAAASAATPGAATTSVAAAPAPASSSAPVSLSMVDIAFEPTELTIAAGTDVVVNVVNEGAATHNFNIDALNIHSGDYAAGQKGTVTINAPAGTYEYYCSQPGHKEAGMVGKLIVK